MPRVLDQTQNVAKGPWTEKEDATLRRLKKYVVPLPGVELKARLRFTDEKPGDEELKLISGTEAVSLRSGIADFKLRLADDGTLLTLFERYV